MPILFSTLFSLFLGLAPIQELKHPAPVRSVAEAQKDRTRSLGQIGLTEKESKEIANKIKSLIKDLGGPYPIAEGVNMAMYALRFLGEIGNYVIVHEDIVTLIEGFERLASTGQTTPVDLGPTVWNIIDQIDKVEFKREKGKITVIAYSKNPQEGILIPAEEEEKPGSGLKRIHYVRIKEGTKFTFIPLAPHKAFEKITGKNGFINEEVDFKSIHQRLYLALVPYLAQKRPVESMEVKAEGVEALVTLEEEKKNVRKQDVLIEIKKAYTLPGIRDYDHQYHLAPLPSLLLSVEGRVWYHVLNLVPFKVGIDGNLSIND